VKQVSTLSSSSSSSIFWVCCHGWWEWKWWNGTSVGCEEGWW